MRMAQRICRLRGPVVLFGIKGSINKPCQNAPQRFQKFKFLLARHVIFFQVRQVFFQIKFFLLQIYLLYVRNCA